MSSPGFLFAHQALAVENNVRQPGSSTRCIALAGQKNYLQPGFIFVVEPWLAKETRASQGQAGIDTAAGTPAIQFIDNKTEVLYYCAGNQVLPWEI